MPLSTHDQIRIVKRTWSFFRNMSPEYVGDVFYSKLFMDYPELEKRYPGSLRERSEDLMKMVSKVIGRLDRQEELIGALTEIAVRPHKAWVTEAHYRKVASTLIWTLEKGLGNDWSPEVAEAWKSCIATVGQLNAAVMSKLQTGFAD